MEQTLVVILRTQGTCQALPILCTSLTFSLNIAIHFCHPSRAEGTKNIPALRAQLLLCCQVAFLQVITPHLCLARLLTHCTTQPRSFHVYISDLISKCSLIQRLYNWGRSKCPTSIRLRLAFCSQPSECWFPSFNLYLKS